VTLLTLLTAFAVVGVIVAVLVIFLQRGRDTFDLSLDGLLRAYLYVASLAAVIVFAAGIAGLTAYVLGAALGLDFVYGGPIPQPAIAPAPCPPDTVCPPGRVFFPENDYRRFQQSQDLIRGVTFVLFGAIFWGAHWLARRALAPRDEHASGLYRAYLMVGTVIFGIATIALVPFGIFQALSYLIGTAQPGAYRPGAGDALPGGLAALPIWLVYLWLVLRTIRGGSSRMYVAGPRSGGPPPEPAPVGSRIGPGPSSRSAGAEATPPEERR
jgi:uncharacterized protein DUF5671